MMFYDFMRKLTAEQSHDNLLEAFGDKPHLSAQWSVGI